jgi:hypothetical protein
MPVYWEVFLDGAGDELDRLSKGPDMRTITAMEAALLEGFTITEGRVHVITGALKASGHPDSSFGEDTWEGVINFAHYPGIFELARANSPTRYHPMGGHYFFDPGGPIFEKKVRQAVWDWVTDYKGGEAPPGDLGPYSGGF